MEEKERQDEAAGKKNSGKGSNKGSAGKSGKGSGKKGTEKLVMKMESLSGSRKVEMSIDDALRAKFEAANARKKKVIVSR